MHAYPHRLVRNIEVGPPLADRLRHVIGCELAALHSPASEHLNCQLRQSVLGYAGTHCVLPISPSATLERRQVTNCLLGGRVDHELIINERVEWRYLGVAGLPPYRV